MAMPIFLACLVGMAAGAAAEVVNTQVQRKIDVSTQFAKVRQRELSSVCAALSCFLPEGVQLISRLDS